ncbi:ABC transporter ATP-binding protein, partial [Aquimarina celericrescens]|nr:ABC transporter ATP-binding protein [Aquimarina celericrescens]
EKVCSHVVIIRKGVKLYSGRVDEMNASYGFFELKSNQNSILKEWLSKHKDFKNFKEEEDKITAFLAHELDAESLNRQLFKEGIVLT